MIYTIRGIEVEIISSILDIRRINHITISESTKQFLKPFNYFL